MTSLTFGQSIPMPKATAAHTIPKGADGSQKELIICVLTSGSVTPVNISTSCNLDKTGDLIGSVKFFQACL